MQFTNIAQIYKVHRKEDGVDCNKDDDCVSQGRIRVEDNEIPDLRMPRNGKIQNDKEMRRVITGAQRSKSQREEPPCISGTRARIEQECSMIGDVVKERH